MSSYRYPDNRNGRDRSPPYRDRRPSAFGGGYPPRANDSARPNQDSGNFPPREVPRGPKSLSDAPRGPAPGGSSGAPTTPRDGRGRGFPGRGEPTPLRDAPPLSSGPAPPMTNTHNSWRADRDRDRDFDRDRRERRPTPPPRRSPIRDLRDRQGLRSRILLCLAPGRPTAAVGLDEAEVEGTLVGEEGLFTTMIATDTMIHGIVHQTVLTGHVAGHRCVEIETCETTGISTEGTVMIAVFPGSTTLT